MARDNHMTMRSRPSQTATALMLIAMLQRSKQGHECQDSKPPTAASPPHHHARHPNAGQHQKNSIEPPTLCTPNNTLKTPPLLMPPSETQPS